MKTGVQSETHKTCNGLRLRYFLLTAKDKFPVVFTVLLYRYN